nr:ABC transporter permease subunit [Haladaptatus sp. DYF46]
MVALVGIGSVLLSFRSVVHERETGTLKTHLGLPHSRGEILLGKVVGRAGAIALVIGCVFLVGTGIGWYEYGNADIVGLLATGLLTVVYALVGVSLGTAISAVSQSERTATAITVGYIMCFPIFWDGAISLWVFHRIQTVFPSAGTEIYFVIKRLSPSNIYNVLTNTITGVGNSTAPWMHVIFAKQPGVETNLQLVSQTFSETPLLLTPGTSLIVLCVWGVIPLGLAYSWFQRIDFGSTSQ